MCAGPHTSTIYHLLQSSSLSPHYLESIRSSHRDDQIYPPSKRQVFQKVFPPLVLPPLSPLSITTSCAQGKAHRWRSLGWSRQCSSSNCWMDSTRFRDYMDTCITSHVARSHQSYQDHSCSDPAFFHDCMRTRITEPTPIDPTRIIPTRTSHPSVMHAHLHHAPWSLLPSIIPGSFHLGPHVQSHLLAATQATCGHSSTTSGFTQARGHATMSTLLTMSCCMESTPDNQTHSTRTPHPWDTLSCCDNIAQAPTSSGHTLCPPPPGPPNVNTI